MKFLSSLIEKFTGKPVDWDQVEESLVRADLGVPMAIRILEALRKLETYRTVTADDVTEIARDEILRVLPKTTKELERFPDKPNVVLIVGVNGAGKTTSTAKLAHYLKARRNPVLLAAADTFRAAAIEQLATWSERIGVELIRGQYNADPAALCYEAYVAAQKRNAQFLICDTAGRLHTKSNLMAELTKIKRTIAKHDPAGPHETLLVVDATTGGNALVQAREFNQAIGLTGLIVTKLDGSGKGGVVVAIQDELKIPTRFIGTGEKLENFAMFDPKQFVAGIF